LVFNPFLSLVLLRLMELSLSAAVVVGFFYLMIRLTQAIEPHEIAAGLLSWLLCVAFIELVPMWVAWCAPNARLPVS